jgi:hypothetical protein
MSRATLIERGAETCNEGARRRGGIGGFVTAHELDQLGMEARVFESVDEMRPRGVGIDCRHQHSFHDRGTLPPGRRRDEYSFAG